MNSKKKSARNAGERHKSSTISSADPTSISKCNQVHGKNIQQVNRENTAEQTTTNEGTNKYPKDHHFFWKEKIVNINLLLLKITTDIIGRQQGEGNSTISVADGKRSSRGSLQPVKEIRIHDDCLYTDRFTAHTSSKQSECASKMYATKAMEFDRLNKVNSSGSSLTPTKQQSLEEIISQLNYAYSILYTPTEEVLPQNILTELESMLHEMGQKCLVMRGSKKNLVNTSCRLLISYSKNSNGNAHQNNQQVSQKQQELIAGYSNTCAKSSQQVDLFGLSMFYLGMVEILLNRQETISLQHLYQARQSFEDQQSEYANATELIDHVSSIIQHIQQQQIASTQIVPMTQSTFQVHSAQQNILNKSKESSGLHSQSPQQQNKEILIKKHNKNAQSSSASSHTINNHNKNSLPRKTSPVVNTNDNQIHPVIIGESHNQTVKATQQALQLGFEKLQKTSEPKYLSVYSPREENPFKSQLAAKLFKSSHPSPAFTPRGNITISGSSTQRDNNQQTYTSRLRTGRMKVSGKEIIIQKIKNGYFEKGSFNAEVISRNNSKSPSIIKDTINKSLLESARKQEAKKTYSPFAIPNSSNTAVPAENPQQLRDCLISQRTQKSKNVSSLENPSDLKQYLLKEKRYSNPQFQPQDLKIEFLSQVNTHRTRNENSQKSGDKIVSSSQLYQPEIQQEAVQQNEVVHFGQQESQSKNNNYFSHQLLAHSQGKSKFSQWKDSQQTPQTSQKDTSHYVNRPNDQRNSFMTQSSLQNQAASKRSHNASKIPGDIQQEQQTKRDENNLTNSHEKVLNQTNAQITQFFPQTTQGNGKFTSQADKQTSNNTLDKSYQMNSKQQGNCNTDEKCNRLPNNVLNLSKSFEKQSNVMNNFPNHSGIQDNSSHNNNNNTSYLQCAEFNAVLKPSSSSSYSRNTKNSIKKLQHPKSATLKKNSAPIVYPIKLGDQSFRTASNTTSLSSAHPLNNTITPSTQSYFPHQFLQETSEFNLKQIQNPQVFSNTLSVTTHTTDLSQKAHQQTQIIPKTSSCTSSSKRNCFNNSSYQNHQLHSSQLELELQQTQKHLQAAKNNLDNCVQITPKKKNTQASVIPPKEQQKLNSTQAQYSATRSTLHQQQQPQQPMQDYQVNRMSNISSFHGDSSNSTQDSLCFLKSNKL